jgi:hypothetical protein
VRKRNRRLALRMANGRRGPNRHEGLALATFDETIRLRLMLVHLTQLVTTELEVAIAEQERATTTNRAH